MTITNPTAPSPSEIEKACDRYGVAERRARETWAAAVAAERDHQEARLRALSLIYRSPLLQEPPAPPVLSEEQAVAAYTALVEQLAKTWGYDGDGELVAHPVVEQGAGNWPIGPVLCRNFEGWSTTSAWAVVWEGGPFEWALLSTCGGTSEFGLQVEAAQLPDGVGSEAINSYSISLYPEA